MQFKGSSSSLGIFGCMSKSEDSGVWFAKERCRVYVRELQKISLEVVEDYIQGVCKALSNS